MRNKPILTRKNHLISDDDFTKDEILSILELIRKIKNAHYQGVQIPILKNKVLGMMFDQPSTRTRVSFETAMTQLGGHAEFLEFKSLHVGEGHETMRDTAEVISRMVDAIVIRTCEQKTIESFADYAFVPVINGCSLDLHPTQAICDLFTMKEHLPDREYKDMTIMAIGDTNREYDRFCPVSGSMFRMAAILGMTYISCGPKEMQMCEEDQKIFNDLAKDSDAKLILTTEPEEYIGQTDFTMSDAWWYHGAESEEFKSRRLNLLFPKYSVNQKLVNKGKKELGVMHCLPGFRDFEISNEVWDGPNSLLFEEAENRLHAEKGILAWFLYGQEKSEALRNYHRGVVEDYLNECYVMFNK